MAVKTIQLDDLEKYVDNIYEAIVVIAKRAKQINDEQKRIIETENTEDEALDDYSEDNESKVDTSHYIKLPKPTTVALQEMLAGKIHFEYLNREESS